MDYEEIGLSNIKLLCRPDQAVIIDRRLEKIDSILREIDLNNGKKWKSIKPCEDEISESPADDFAQKTDDSYGKVHRVTLPSKTFEHKRKSFIPYLTTMQYENIEDISSAVQAFVEDYHNRRNIEVSNEAPKPCHHCVSVDVVQTEKLTRLHDWRKCMMATHSKYLSKSFKHEQNDQTSASHQLSEDDELAMLKEELGINGDARN